MPDITALSRIGRWTWDTRYRYREAGDNAEGAALGASPTDGGGARRITERATGPGAAEPSPEASWRRVAVALAEAETSERPDWERRFYRLIRFGRFLPAGRILAVAGTHRRATLFNCFVMGRIEDSMNGIFRALRESALTLQAGGGIGCDFSTLRPAGSLARGSGAPASGPVSFMGLWDRTCETVLATRSRRGAMMGTLRCDHPDVGEFIAAKQRPGVLSHFNLSVLITDAFMQAVERDELWALVFPEDALEPADVACVMREWPGYDRPAACRVYGQIPARKLWERLLRCSYACGEPGVLFIDQVNRMNNLAYRERITATNPCGEAPLPPYGACDLGSFNLPRYVRAPWSPRARIDVQTLEQAVPTAVRMLDNVIDVSAYPLGPQARQARETRRIGLGITGLADALIMLGLHYDSPDARALAGDIAQRICHAAYRASTELARERGSFPALSVSEYLSSRFIAALPEDIRAGIARYGIRNSHLMAIAPAGSISLLAGNVSSGIEPVFALHQRRRLRQADGRLAEVEIEDYAHRRGRRRIGPDTSPVWVTAAELSTEAHLGMQAAMQRHVDQSVSKTINLREDLPFDKYRRVYDDAYRMELKGCTTFRPTALQRGILSRQTPEAEADAAPSCRNAPC